MLIRNANNPIITRSDIPDILPHLHDVTSVFNPGAIKFIDKYLLMLRVQNRARETYLVMAESDDGVKFSVRNEIVRFDGLKTTNPIVYHIYDPRITKIEDIYYIMFAMDFEAGCKLGVAQTTDFVEFKFIGVAPRLDTRNGVLFPEKFNGKFLRLERPNTLVKPGEPATGARIWVSESTQLTNWKMLEPILMGQSHYWDEHIGSGPPPVKTKEGWLHIYHGVATHFGSSNIYQAGVVLLDLKQPQKVLARGKYNILEPREMYELTGQVPNVVFPSGMIVEDYDAEGFALLDSEVKVYYGAADTCVCLAETTIQDLLSDCRA
jgi:predicted GH43/DUF377 family glycosyl hydrolase